ncbi:hypothetical protein N9W01_00650 [bacterium]|nr:hypothetical protein [bacterium]
MDNYEQLAMDEAYDILLYNPDASNIIKLNLIENLIEYYTNVEDYEKCKNLIELKKVMEKDNESNNKET